MSSQPVTIPEDAFLDGNLFRAPAGGKSDGKHAVQDRRREIAATDSTVTAGSIVVALLWLALYMIAMIYVSS